MNTIAKVFVGLICLVIVVPIALAVLSAAATSVASVRATSPDPGMACVMAEKLIKPQLKSPSSAEFDYADCKENAHRSGDTWTIRSYVDADNSFGAHIRTYYTAKLTNTPPSDTWRLIDVTFD